MKVYFEEIDKSKCLTVVSTNDSKENTLKNEELWSKIRDLNRSMTKNSYDYDERHMKIKFKSDEELLLNKMMEISNMTVVVRDAFHENNKCYPQVFCR